MKSIYIFVVLLVFYNLQKCLCQSPEAEEEEAEEVTESETKTEHPIIEEEKNFKPSRVPQYHSIILGKADATLALSIGPIMKKSLALTTNRHWMDTVPFNLKIIEKKFNSDYKNSLRLLKTVRSVYPEVEDYLIVNEKGFICDSSFCEKYGNGYHAFGICSPFLCKCDGKAKGMKCFKGLVFDPIFDNCDDPVLVKICGL